MRDCQPADAEEKGHKVLEPTDESTVGLVED